MVSSFMSHLNKKVTGHKLGIRGTQSVSNRERLRPTGLLRVNDVMYLNFFCLLHAHENNNRYKKQNNTRARMHIHNV